MSNQDDVGIEYKFMMDLILKKDYSVEDAKRTVKELFEEVIDVEINEEHNRDIGEYGFINIKRSCGANISVRIKNISTIEKYADKAVISVDGYQVYTAHTVYEIFNLMIDYRKCYGFN